ncbi:hypothetical protein [Lewinella sp. 4G2]|uniref:hypothetical protein n=1 Tax=Lewinella sp. 4G2 TaxID=1803372 RepID=UPI0007B4C21E|nr:hypothetical protein [Lewinella sp. 4G2]OAV43799.1 hypothetical protein A3850_004480 [Lewinella sp. 4G2]
MEAYGLSVETAGALRLVFDTGALVLIWLVQLVIYPVFLRMQRSDFVSWHPVYTRRVTFVVMPIMLGQLALYAYLCLSPPTEWNVVANSTLILIAWGLTFFGAVPLHAALDGPDDHLPLSSRLLRINAARTLVWTLVWAFTMVARFAPFLLT